MKKDLMPKNNKGEPHGYWEVYHSLPILYFKGVYENGLQVGYHYHHTRETLRDNYRFYYRLSF